jgi:hypothetical protein
LTVCLHGGWPSAAAAYPGAVTGNNPIQRKNIGGMMKTKHLRNKTGKKVKTVTLRRRKTGRSFYEFVEEKKLDIPHDFPPGTPMRKLWRQPVERNKRIGQEIYDAVAAKFVVLVPGLRVKLYIKINN